VLDILVIWGGSDLHLGALEMKIWQTSMRNLITIRTYLQLTKHNMSLNHAFNPPTGRVCPVVRPHLPQRLSHTVARERTHMPQLPMPGWPKENYTEVARIVLYAGSTNRKYICNTEVAHTVSYILPNTSAQVPTDISNISDFIWILCTFNIRILLFLNHYIYLYVYFLV